MRTNKQNLEFAVDLAARDLKQNNLAKWRQKLEQFFHGGDVFAEPQLSPGVPLPGDFRLQDFEALKEVSRTILADVVGGLSAKIHAPEAVKLKEIELQVVVPAKKKARAYLLAYGSTHDMFVYKLMQLFDRDGTGKILACGAPAPGEDDAKCGRLFYRKGRQKFCSKKCTNRVTMRSLRKERSYLESERDEAHERYKKRIEQVDPTRKVTRRPRK